MRGYGHSGTTGGCRTVASALSLGLIVAANVGGARAETMVRYDHPVWHNGHQVLYHGAWRGHAGAVAHARKSKPDEADDDGEDDAKPSKSTYASTHEFIVLVDTDDSTSLRMATELVNAAKASGLQARAWAGKSSPAAVAGFVEKDGGDFIVTAIDVLAADPKAAELRGNAPLVARLANEPIVVIAGAGIDSVKALDGRPVSFGQADGVVDASGQALFAKLGIAPKVVHANVSASLAALAAGKIDALVMLGADESRAVNEAAKTGKLHAVPLKWSSEFVGRYAPARLTPQDLPGLTPPNGVESVSVPFGLIAIDAADNSPRAAQDAPFVAALFERYKPLLVANADPKWREVNLTADTDWPRLAPARGWIEKHRAGADPALDSFRDAASSSTTTTPETADKLYKSLLRTGGAQP
jgi:hypothetical protein